MTLCALLLSKVCVLLIQLCTSGTHSSNGFGPCTRDLWRARCYYHHRRNKTNTNQRYTVCCTWAPTVTYSTSERFKGIGWMQFCFVSERKSIKEVICSPVPIRAAGPHLWCMKTERWERMSRVWKRGFSSFFPVCGMRGSSENVMTLELLCLPMWQRTPFKPSHLGLYLGRADTSVYSLHVVVVTVPLLVQLLLAQFHVDNVCCIWDMLSHETKWFKMVCKVKGTWKKNKKNDLNHIGLQLENCFC